MLLKINEPVKICCLFPLVSLPRELLFLCLDRRVWDSGNWNIKYTLCVKSKHYKLFEFKKAVSYVYDNLFANLHMLN